jgi:type IV pilus assembly protein PilY1
VVSGLREALSNMQVRTGAAAAAATSTPNITLTDNDIFSPPSPRCAGTAN